MFLILRGEVTERGTEWCVVTSARERPPSREAAENIARSLAHSQKGHPYSVVEIKNWFQWEIEASVRETRIG